MGHPNASIHRQGGSGGKKWLKTFLRHTYMVPKVKACNFETTKNVTLVFA